MQLTLARRLGLRSEEVVQWSLGSDAPDTATFVFVLGFIMQETQKLAAAAMAHGVTEQALARARDRSRAA